MTRRLLLSGLLGGVTLILWTAVMNVGFGLAVRTQMNEIPNADAVYRLLKEHVVVPGAYMVNPAPLPGGAFPPGEPVFSVRYSGVGHEAAGLGFLVELAVALASAVLAAGLLSVTSPRILSRYPYKVLYVAVIGLLLAAFGDIPKFGIGGYPASVALLLAANDAMAWAFAGVVMAWVMRVPADAPTAT